MGTGGILAKYAAEGIDTYLVTATRGEYGWWGKKKDYPGEEGLGRIREEELCSAAEVLGLKEVSFLDYIDGELDQSDPQEVIGKLAAHIRRVKPHVVVTFDPYGAYGHPDHIAISQFTTSAVLAAADPEYHGVGSIPQHRVSKLYYLTFNEAFGDLVMNIDGVERRAASWIDWAVTTIVDASNYWQVVWNAVSQHCSQLPGYQSLLDLPEDRHRGMWGTQTFYRALSLVNGGRKVETDLFAGLR
jgi:LmbE family N-acetylglucosaminyl deacetylase